MKIVNELKTLVGQFGQDIKAIDPVLEKASKKLAKKVIRGFTLADVELKSTNLGSANKKIVPVKQTFKNSPKVHPKKAHKISTDSAPVKN